MSGRTINLTARRAGNMSFVARADSGHWTVTDVDVEVGGDGAAMTPFEHLFASLATCTGTDVLYVMQKKRIPLDDLRIELRAKCRSEYPQIATEIHLHYIFIGNNIPADAAERAIELSQNKYCPVTGQLAPTAKVTHSYEILTPDETRKRLKGQSGK